MSLGKKVEKEVTDTILADVLHSENKTTRQYPTPKLDTTPITPNTNSNAFDSSNSSIPFRGLPLTPAIVIEPLSSAETQKTDMSHIISTSKTRKEGENTHHSTTEERDNRLLSRKDIITICISALLISVLGGAILVLVVHFFGLKTARYERSIFALIIIIITFIFTFTVIAMCVKVQSKANKTQKETQNQIIAADKHHKTQRKRTSTGHKIRTWSKGDLLGCGSFGKVYMALDHHSLQMFVVKQVELIKDNSGNSLFKEQIKSMQIEVRTLSKLSHPNIVRYLGSSSSKNHLNIFLEYMSGGSIAQMLLMFGPFELPLIKSYTMQILNGLSFLHGQNIIHRDIKGSNILVNPDGCLKLADFGVCFSFDNQWSMNQKPLPTSIHGTVHWMAPEVIHQNRYDYKCDIYSLGITILEMINGHPPHYNKDAVSVMFLMMKPIKQESENFYGGIHIPNSLGKYGKTLVKQCLQRNPDLRPSSKELLEDHPFLYLQDDVGSDLYDEEEEDRRRDVEEEAVEHVQNGNKLKCINDVKHIVGQKVEYQNKVRNQLLNRKYKRLLLNKIKK